MKTMAVDSSTSVTSFLKGRLPPLPFGTVKKAILGANYELSVVLAGDRRLAAINKKFRGRDGTANVLAFPLSKNCGELFLNWRLTQRECRKHRLPALSFAVLLVIHGCLHLKGYDHGSKMKAQEQKWLGRFGIGRGDKQLMIDDRSF